MYLCLRQTKYYDLLIRINKGHAKDDRLEDAV